MTGLAPIVEAHTHELVAFRRAMHVQPELSGAEHLTTERILDRLQVEGLTPVVLGTGTGVICDIPLDAHADLDPDRVPVVALRADIDGLAMDDLTDTPYRSRVAGVAHACGHDVHTAVVLGAGLALLAQREAHPRAAIVRLLFEPAEETVPGGAVDVIAEGWLQDVRSVFGVHCDPKLDVGTLGLRTGPLTSAADQFTLTLTGPGGHTARPRQTVDLVRWTARIADRLWDAVQARCTSPVTLVFGAVHAGAAPNVIPSTAVLRGSFRTADRATWADAERVVREVIASMLVRDDIGEPPTWGLDYVRGLPPVVNDIATTALVRRVVEREFGPDASRDTPQSGGGDSFAWYTEVVPGTYIRLGTHDPDRSGLRLDLHAATFDVDERCIAIGARLLAATALAAVDG